MKNYFNNLPSEIKEVISGKSWEAWSFGNDYLLKLVLEGKKTATTGIFNKEKVSKASLGVITDSKDIPRCIVEYTSIEVKPFLEVTFDFAQAEGEGFKNIEEWRDEHCRVFSNWSKNTFKDTDLVVCTRFKLVHLIPGDILETR